MKMNYGAKIKDLLGDRDQKQKALAKALNLSESTLSNYITQRTELPLEVLAQVASHFSVTTDYLLGLTGDPAPPFPVSPEERILVSRYRALTGAQRELVDQGMELMEKQNRRG